MKVPEVYYNYYLVPDLHFWIAPRWAPFDKKKSSIILSSQLFTLILTQILFFKNLECSSHGHMMGAICDSMRKTIHFIFSSF